MFPGSLFTRKVFFVDVPPQGLQEPAGQPTNRRAANKIFLLPTNRKSEHKSFLLPTNRKSEHKSFLLLIIWGKICENYALSNNFSTMLHCERNHVIHIFNSITMLVFIDN